MAKQITQKTAIAALSYKSGKNKGKKNASLKQGSSSGSAPVGGNARPSYTVMPVSVIALPPGKGPPMSSDPGRGQSIKKKKKVRKNA